MDISRTKISLMVIAACSIAPARGYAAAPLAALSGAAFQGGGQKQVGSSFYGRQQVNMVYAQPTGRAAAMTGLVKLDRLPVGRQYLLLEAMDDDAPPSCRIRVALNGHPFISGPSGFPNGQWQVRRFAIPAGVLEVGTNKLTIVNQEPTGSLGFPPWFMVAQAAIGGPTFKIASTPVPTYHVQLPKKALPFPEPLAPGEHPGFKFRGTKGWAWTPQQYLAEIPYLAKFKMNFLMNCYLSMFDIEHYRWNDPRANRWWEPFPPAKKKAYAKVVRECQKYGIQFCFSMNPNLLSRRIVNDDSAKSVDELYRHYAWMQSLGVKWFNISLDDAGRGVNPATQAAVVNDILHRLRAKDPDAQMIFCPTFYWGDGTETNQMNLGMDQKPYLETLAHTLDKDVYVFWTGNGVLGKVTLRAAKNFRRLVGHRLFLWDNYPVNDDHPTLHLGPVMQLDPRLCEVIDGYISNPMCKEDQINRIPLATCADYAYNPFAYDPARSIGQAILLLGRTRPQQEILKDLVEAYPGFLVTGGGTGNNPVRSRFAGLLGDMATRRDARAWYQHIARLSSRFDKAFPGQYPAAKKQIANDLAWMKGKL